MRRVYISSFLNVGIRVPVACGSKVKEVLGVTPYISSVNAPAPGRRGSIKEIAEVLKTLSFPQALRLLLLVKLEGDEELSYFEGKGVLVNLSPFWSPDEALLFERSRKLSLYLLAKSLGLGSCKKSTCLMGGFKASYELDTLGYLCSSCERELKAQAISEKST